MRRIWKYMISGYNCAIYRERDITWVVNSCWSTRYHTIGFSLLELLRRSDSRSLSREERITLVGGETLLHPEHRHRGGPVTCKPTRNGVSVSLASERVRSIRSESRESFGSSGLRDGNHSAAWGCSWWSISRSTTQRRGSGSVEVSAYLYVCVISE